MASEMGPGFNSLTMAPCPQVHSAFTSFRNILRASGTFASAFASPQDCTPQFPPSRRLDSKNLCHLIGLRRLSPCHKTAHHRFPSRRLERHEPGVQRAQRVGTPGSRHSHVPPSLRPEGTREAFAYARRHRPPAKVSWLGWGADLHGCFDRLHSTPTGSRHAAQEWMRSSLSWDKRPIPSIPRADSTGVPSPEVWQDTLSQNTLHDRIPGGVRHWMTRWAKQTQESTRCARADTAKAHKAGPGVPRTSHRRARCVQTRAVKPASQAAQNIRASSAELWVSLFSFSPKS
ncbi:MAG: hypothetical protein CJBNEKGG_04463 [Prosthecobacter sp.]|nr:hypothetical protein [Prosthecobacter sp.]